jgi:uncharacterized protein involved in response to NO
VGLLLAAVRASGQPLRAAWPIHLIAMGGLSVLIIGMITRTARGHTGRPLKVGTAEVVAYSLMLAAAVSRVLLPLVAPQWTSQWVIVAAVAWSAAFVVYLGVYAPWLLRGRADGKDG